MEKARIGISTASFCLWDITPTTKLSISRDLDFSRVEIGLSTVKMLKEFTLLTSLFNQLDAFCHVTINVPWCHVRYGKNKQTQTVIDYLKLLDQMLKIDAFIFRIDCISDFSLLNSSGLNIYLENSEKEDSWIRLRDITKSYDYQCVLDINRATRNENYLEKMVDELGDRIAEVQVNGYIDGFYRVPLSTSKQYHLLDKVKDLTVPFIIEGLFPPDDYQSILQEKGILKNLLT